MGQYGWGGGRLLVDLQELLNLSSSQGGKAISKVIEYYFKHI